MSLKKTLLRMDMSKLSPDGLKGRAYLLRGLGEDIGILEKDPVKLLAEFVKSYLDSGSIAEIVNSKIRNKTAYLKYNISFGNGHVAQLLMDQDAMDVLIGNYLVEGL